MRAVVVRGPGRYGWEDIPSPQPGPGEALVRIEAVGLCNSTDSELIDGSQPYRPPYPFVLGHESVGTVTAVGPGVTRFRIGDRVTRAGTPPPGGQLAELYSGWGGFAELGVVREANPQNLVLPTDLEPTTAFLSISLAETRAFLEQIEEEQGPIAGRSAIVVGTGIAGLTLCRWCREAGAARVVCLGRRPERLRLAEQSGAHLALRGDEATIEAIGGPADVLFEAIGKPSALPALAELLRPGGLVAIYGAAEASAYQQAYEALPAGLTVSRPGPQEQRYVVRIAERLRSGDIDAELWRTHIWPAEQIHEAFAAVARGEVVKGCLTLG